MRIELKIASVAAETGALLTQYLIARGLIIHPEADITIGYGVPSTRRKSLNGECGSGDKVHRLIQMNEGGCRTVPWFAGNTIPIGFSFPALARQRSGHGGEDIVSVFQPEEVPWRIASGWHWFSSYIPVQAEYRVWIFRDACLDVYEKTMCRQDEYMYVGRNFRNGFNFVVCPRPPMDAILQATTCVRALRLDFGAVDVLLGKDGLMYVLECNTAPGVIKSNAQKTLGKLADEMAAWVKQGSPERPY